VENISVVDSESSYYYLKFFVEFDRKFPIVGIMFDTI